MSTFHEIKGSPVPQTVLVTLSSSNRASILKDSAELAVERRPEAEIIMSRLGELNPDLAEQFRYKETALENLTLRMICLSDAAPVKYSTAHVP